MPYAISNILTKFFNNFFFSLTSASDLTLLSVDKSAANNSFADILGSWFRITAWLSTFFFSFCEISTVDKNHTGTRGMLFCLLYLNSTENSQKIVKTAKIEKLTKRIESGNAARKLIENENLVLKSWTKQKFPAIIKEFSILIWIFQKPRIYPDFSRSNWLNCSINNFWKKIILNTRKIMK